jgi:hypothetical protein
MGKKKNDNNKNNNNKKNDNKKNDNKKNNNNKKKNEKQKREDRRNAAAQQAATTSAANKIAAENEAARQEANAAAAKKAAEAEQKRIQSYSYIMYITYFVSIIILINYFAIAYIKNFVHSINKAPLSTPFDLLHFIFYSLKDKEQKLNTPKPKNPQGFIYDLISGIIPFETICNFSVQTFFLNYWAVGFYYLAYSLMYYWYNFFNGSNTSGDDVGSFIKLFTVFVILFLFVYTFIYLNLLQTKGSKGTNAIYDMLNAIFSIFLFIFVFIFILCVIPFLFMLFKCINGINTFGSYFFIILIISFIIFLSLSIYAYGSKNVTNFDVDGYTIVLLLFSLILFLPLWITPIYFIFYMLFCNFGLLFNSTNSKFAAYFINITKDTKSILLNTFFILPLFVTGIYFFIESINFFNKKK